METRAKKMARLSPALFEDSTLALSLRSVPLTFSTTIEPSQPTFEAICRIGSSSVRLEGNPPGAIRKQAKIVGNPLGRTGQCLMEKDAPDLSGTCPPPVKPPG
jgi:hypothetical protein